jgi:DNA-binding MarR family transcriptional regulator
MASVMSGRKKTGGPWDAVSTSHLLHRVQQLASDRFSLLTGENGVTFRQYVILAAIAESPGASQTDLARATGVDRSTLADVMQRLERNRLIERRDSESDARANFAELTPAGAETLAKARQHARAADSAILDALSPTKRKTFHSMLSRLAEYADAIARKAEHDAKRQAKREAKQRAKERKKAQARADKDAPSNDNPSQKRKGRRKAGVR